jgi:hypothetical protein
MSEKAKVSALKKVKWMEVRTMNLEYSIGKGLNDIMNK